MTILLMSEADAAEFIVRNIRREVEKIIVEMNPNGSYVGDAEFDPEVGDLDLSSAAAAITAGANALGAGKSKIEISKANGKYTVVAT